MNYTDLTEREKEFLAIIRTMTDEQRDECLSDLQKILKKKEAEPQ